MAGLTTNGLAASQTALTEYLRRYAEPNRYDNYEYRQFGTEAMQPDGMGLNIYAPTFTKAVTSLRGSEKTGTSEFLRDDGVSARGMSFGSYSGSLEYYWDYFEISKVFAATATLKGYLERGSEWLMKGCALTEEEVIQQHLFGDIWAGACLDEANFLALEADGTLVQAGGATWGAVTLGSVTPNTVAVMRRELRKNRNPGFRQLGGKFALIGSPDVTYQLITNTTAPSMQADSMNMTDAYRNNRIGDIFGFTLFESTSAPYIDVSAVTNEAATTDHEYLVGLAPDAFYVASHETLNPQLYFKGFGETNSPVDNYATLGIDFMFDAFGNQTANTKMIVCPHTTTS